MNLFCFNSKFEQLKGKGYTSIPKLFTQPFYDELYKLYDQVIDLMSQDTYFYETYKLASERWKSIAKNNNLYGRFFKPYYRDRRGVIGTDEKVILQTCPSFYQYLAFSFYNIYMNYPVLERLKSKLMAIILAHKKHVVQFIHLMDDGLKKVLMPESGETPVSIRILRYEKDSKLSTNPHVDKTAFTLILNTNDPPDREKLIVRNVDEPIKYLSQYEVPKIHEDHSLLFFGAALEQAGHKAYKALAHAVLPFNHSHERYSIILFWHLPNFDMSNFSTKVEFSDDLNLARNGALGI